MACNKCTSGCSSCSSVPYYQQADVCIEDHCLTVQQPQFSFSLCPTSSWNVPSCGQPALLSVPGLVGATVGAFLWHPQFGYFEITAVDAINSTVSIVNDCREGNASPGTQIPACTCFVVTDPPAEDSDTTGLCVAVSFTAPEEDVPTDITLTSTTGLTAGDTIEIGTGFYFVQKVKPDNIITIVNQGQGIAPGTPVIAQDALGNYQYCLSVISVNPCDRPAERVGALLVCNEEGASVPLQNTGGCRVPITVGNENNDVILAPLDSDCPLCIDLTADFSITGGSVGPYSMTVSDTTGFVAGDIVIIEFSFYRFLVTAVPDANTLTVEVTTIPGANQTWAPGTGIICQIGCCEDIRNELACVVQGARFSIDPIFQITGAGGVPAVVYAGQTGGGTLGEIFEYTAPDDCPGSTYRLEAVLNVSGLANHDNGIIGFEFKAAWSNNLSEGRMNWVDFGSDGFDIGPGPYPTGPLDPIWDILTDAADLYPMMYHSGYIIISTVVASGVTVTLDSNYKWIVGDNNAPTALTRVSFYVIGNCNVTKIT